MISVAPFLKSEMEIDPKTIVNYLYSRRKQESDTSQVDPLRTPFPAKDIDEVPDLIKQVLINFQEREHIDDNNKISFTTDLPDFNVSTESITYAEIKRELGKFDQGAPFEGKVKNLRPILREERVDPENPDYLIAVYGKFFDNLIRLTCWAKTSSTASKRALWLERIIDEYAWWFTMQGLSRFIFMGRTEDKVIDVNGTKYYGKPLDFYVRTERLSEVSMKTLERMIINIYTNTSGG